MAALTDEQVLESMAGDLRGLLEAKKVSRDVQFLLGRRQIDSAEMFAVMADDREGFWRMARDTLQLDPQGRRPSLSWRRVQSRTHMLQWSGNPSRSR